MFQECEVLQSRATFVHISMLWVWIFSTRRTQIDRHRNLFCEWRRKDNSSTSLEDGMATLWSYTKSSEPSCLARSCLLWSRRISRAPPPQPCLEVSPGKAMTVTRLPSPPFQQAPQSEEPQNHCEIWQSEVFPSLLNSFPSNHLHCAGHARTPSKNSPRVSIDGRGTPVSQGEEVSSESFLME